MADTDYERYDRFHTPDPRIAHHWAFFAPERYALVNPSDAPWVEALLRRERAGAVDNLPSSA